MAGEQAQAAAELLGAAEKPVEKDENGRTIYRLKKPITLGSLTIDKLAFREPKAKDFRAFPLSNQTGGDILDVAAKLCGQTSQVIDELSAEDMIGVGELAVSFFPAGLLTGIAP